LVPRTPAREQRLPAEPLDFLAREADQGLAKAKRVLALVDGVAPDFLVQADLQA